MAKVNMVWTREKAVWLLEDKYNSTYLKSLDDNELLELGEKEGYWHTEEE